MQNKRRQSSREDNGIIKEVRMKSNPDEYCRECTHTCNERGCLALYTSREAESSPVKTKKKTYGLIQTRRTYHARQSSLELFFHNAHYRSLLLRECLKIPFFEHE